MEHKHQLVLLYTISYLFFFMLLVIAKAKKGLRLISQDGLVSNRTMLIVLHVGGIILFGILPISFYSYYTPTHNSSSPFEVAPTLSIVAIAVFFMLFALRVAKKNFNKYPVITSLNNPEDRKFVIIYFFVRILFIVAYEYFFRGYLLNDSIISFGVVPAMLFNICLYALLHIVNGKKEVIACIPFGLLLCVLCIWLQAAWPAIVIHLTLTVSYEYSFLRKNSKTANFHSMSIFVTGASGYLGNKLTNKLAALGHKVNALVRSSASSKSLLHPNVTVFRGDITNKEDLIAAMHGCTQIYHTAAKVGVWASDSSVFYKVNVDGTRNVLDAAISLDIKKIVFTSTCGVIGSTLNEPLNENHLPDTDRRLDYDRSKKEAEDLVSSYIKKGMNIVIVSPSKIYGPGNISHSLTANAIINSFLRKGIAFIPAPGEFKVCFAFIDDVVDGHIRAMEKGKIGEKFILGGINISYLDFFNRIKIISGCRGKIIKLPRGVIKTWAGLNELTYKCFGIPVRVTVQSVDLLFRNFTFSSQKAIQELGYTITPLDEALTQTIQFLKANRTITQ